MTKKIWALKLFAGKKKSFLKAEKKSKIAQIVSICIFSLFYSVILAYLAHSIKMT